MRGIRLMILAIGAVSAVNAFADSLSVTAPTSAGTSAHDPNRAVGEAHTSPGLPSGGSAADMLMMTKTPPALQGSEASGFKVGLNCTDSTGKLIRKGEAGYLNCLEDFQRAKTTSPHSKAQSEAQNPLGITLGH